MYLQLSFHTARAFNDTGPKGNPGEIPTWTRTGWETQRDGRRIKEGYRERGQRENVGVEDEWLHYFSAFFVFSFRRTL